MKEKICMFPEMTMGDVEARVKKDNTEFSKFLSSLHVDEPTKEEIEFYQDKLRISDTKEILDLMVVARGFSLDYMTTVTVTDAIKATIMLSKLFNKIDCGTLAKVILSNKTSRIVTYNIEEVFEVVSNIMMDGTSEDSVDLEKELLEIIKPLVISICFNEREYLNTNGENELMLIQPNIITSELALAILSTEEC